MKYKEYFPIKKRKLDDRLLDHTRGRNAREHALQRMRDMMNVHLRVNKLKRRLEDPLTPEEMALPGVTVDDFPHDPPGYDRVGEDFSEQQKKILQDLRFSEFLVYSCEMRKYLKLSLADCCVKKVHDDDKDEINLRKCETCDVMICIGNWPDHIRSYYHQILYKYKLKKFEFCWLWRKDRIPHKVEDCDVCQKRRKEIRENKQMAFFDIWHCMILRRIRNIRIT